MNEQKRQLWIGIVMDLMVAYNDACDEPSGNDAFLRAMCERVAEAVNADANDDATADFVYEILQRRIAERR